eukprot:GHVQ01004883.1.p1 GENE.GHVQ01004883.1~~GHVQ01004883.1.p1  ORF type:complete len:569 (+),score=50.88 GHVQ01004883.1:210-1916(+)
MVGSERSLPTQGSDQSVWNAVALQDHWSRYLKMPKKPLTSFNNKRIGVSLKATASTAQGHYQTSCTALTGSASISDCGRCTASTAVARGSDCGMCTASAGAARVSEGGRCAASTGAARGSQGGAYTASTGAARALEGGRGTASTGAARGSEGGRSTASTGAARGSQGGTVTASAGAARIVQVSSCNSSTPFARSSEGNRCTASAGAARIPDGSSCNSSTGVARISEEGRGNNEGRDDSATTNHEFSRYYKNLTLAQKMGLLERPLPPLTSNEWEWVRQQSDTRKDGDKPCAICLESFKSREQVILSCSHVYHEECLRSFENFFQGRTCPLCRRDNYYKRRHWSGEQSWRIECAKAIQRAWRGYRDRSKIFNRMNEHSNRGGATTTTMRLRRKYGVKELKRLNTCLIREMADRRDAVDKFMDQTSESVRASADIIEKSLISLMELRNHTRAASVSEHETNSIFDDHTHGWSGRVETDLQSSSVNWESIENKAVCRGEPDCPICCQSVSGSAQHGNDVYLLSCSHVFHKTCLLNFESFHVFDVHKCPVCRGGYSKKLWDRSACSHQKHSL